MKREYDDLVASGTDIAAVVDPVQMKQRFDALGDITGLVDRLRRETAAVDIDTHALVETIASLDPSPGALETLRASPLPDGVVIGKYVHATELSEGEVKRLGDVIATADHQIAEMETELARLSSAGPISTRAELVNARRQRDTDMDGLRSALRPRWRPHHSRWEICGCHQVVPSY
jgi:hypothetical protein